jgi:hypothetical protein
MPTKHPRVPITLDDELGEALARVESIEGRGRPRARLVRDLALRGATAVIDDHAERRRKLHELAVLSTTSDDLFDRGVLGRVDEEAWGH